MALNPGLLSGLSSITMISGSGTQSVVLFEVEAAAASVNFFLLGVTTLEVETRCLERMAVSLALFKSLVLVWNASEETLCMLPERKTRMLRILPLRSFLLVDLSSRTEPEIGVSIVDDDKTFD